jgi:DNA-binding transcriptional LysR family regulator
VRLLTRTTRSVAPTEAGERLLSIIGPRFDEIEAELAALSELRDKPAGTIRITTSIHAAETILWPAVARLLPDYPDLNVEISVDAGFVDIVEGRFDAGIRLGETIAQDMIAVRIGPDLRMAAVASPAYFATREPPVTPHDLSMHNCINLRFPTLGGLYAWEFEKRGRALNVHVEGQLVVNDGDLARQAALDGCGLAYLPEDHVQADIDAGKLTRVLNDWTPPFPGYHLYFPSRRQQSPAFALLVEALRYRGPPAGR